MTTEDRTRAIAWFEKQSKCLAMPGAAKMFGLAAEALNATDVENEPLTLEQLREMHGQPVWIVPHRGIAKWYLVDVANDACATCDNDVVDFELYGPKNTSYGWLAYRRTPERMMKHDT